MCEIEKIECNMCRVAKEEIIVMSWGDKEDKVYDRKGRMHRIKSGLGRYRNYEE